MYINADTLETFDSVMQIRQRFPNTCFPSDLSDDILASFNIFYVTKTTPVYDHILEDPHELPPALINGDWTQQWEAVPKYSTQEEIDQALAAHLAQHKQMKNDEINEARLAANNDTFVYLGHEISCDALSRIDIEATNGIIILNNAMPPNWVGFWNTANNQYIPINTVEEWKAFYISTFNQGAINFVHAQQLKAQLAAATTHDEVVAIHW